MTKQKTIKEKEVVINSCYGGFGLSQLAYKELIKLGIKVKKYNNKNDRKNEKVIYDRKLDNNKKDKTIMLWGRYWDNWTKEDKNRENKLLIKVVKKLKEKASGDYANLQIVKIPNDIEYMIEEYDGLEHISEKHKTYY